VTAARPGWSCFSTSSSLPRSPKSLRRSAPTRLRPASGASWTHRRPSLHRWSSSLRAMSITPRWRGPS